MKTFKISVLTAIGLLYFCISSNAQIQTETGTNPEYMTTTILGEETVFENVQYSGALIARGSFTGGTSIGFDKDSGIFFSTGSGELIPGPNSSCTTGIDNNLPGDATMTGICGSTTYDAAVLQFDFYPVTDTFEIKYIFASEEYNEYINGIYNNDGAGIFISGQNPSGGYYSDLNIAVVPGTNNLPVTVSNINNGYAICGSASTGPCTNCEYYIDNLNGEILEYDGYTTPLTAKIPVVAGETYHIKIAVADCMGPGRDSGLFLEAKDNMTNTNTNSIAEINIFPNPSSGKINITNAGGCTVTIRNCLGNVVKQFKNHNQNTLTTEKLSSGLYFIEIEKDGLKQNRKVIVK